MLKKKTPKKKRTSKVQKRSKKSRQKKRGTSQGVKSQKAKKQHSLLFHGRRYVSNHQNENCATLR